VRRADRITWTGDARLLPPGAIVVEPRTGDPHLVSPLGAHRFTHTGWRPPIDLPAGIVEVLTPPTSVAALDHGYVPVLHPSVAGPPTAGVGRP
jgi:hypothetical protein